MQQKIKFHDITLSGTPFRYTIAIALFTALYFLTAMLGISFSFETTHVSPLWPATGIAFAIIYIFGYRFWPGIALGEFLVNFSGFITSSDHILSSALVSSVMAAGNSIEILTSVYLFKFFSGNTKPLRSSQNVLIFIFISSILPNLIGSVTGVTALCLGGKAAWNNFFYLILTWFTGDTIGDIIITPLLLVFYTETLGKISVRKVLKASLDFGILILLSFLIFQSRSVIMYDLKFLIVPALLYATFTFGLKGATLGNLFLSVISIAFTTKGYGPYSFYNPNDSLLLLQGFIGVMSMTSLLMASLQSQLSLSLTHLENEKLHLEDRVKERTDDLSRTNELLKVEMHEKTTLYDELEESHSTLNNILSASPVPIALTEDRIIRWANEAFYRMFGYPIENELIGKNVRIFYKDQEVFERTGALVYNLLKSQKTASIDTPLVKKDGTIFPANIKMSSSNPENPMKSAILIITDETARIKSEEERIEREKLTGFLEMAGAICHELNQPLQVVLGYSEIMARKIKSNTPDREALDKILSSSNKIAEITKKLMNITHYETREYVLGEKILDINKSSS